MARTALTRREVKFTGVGKAILVKLAEYAAALDALMGDGLAAASVSEVVTTGAMALTCPHSDLSVDGTKTFTLAAGTKIGQRKGWRVTAATNTPNMTITGAFLLGGVAKTSIAHSTGTVGDAASFVWNGAAWVVTSSTGTLTYS